jgi:transcriptional regulator with XRE-family HTH domain
MIDPIDRLVGQNIRVFRTARGISQTELGDAIGVSLQQVQEFEDGANRVGSRRLFEIAEILGVPIGRLFDVEAPPAAAVRAWRLYRRRPKTCT